MKCKIAAYAAFGLMLAVGSAAAADQAMELKSDSQKFSYAFGYDFGSYLKKMNEPFDLAVIERAISDAYTAAAKPLMTREEVQKAQEDFVKKQRAKFLAKAEENKKAAEKFLAENKGKEGVKSTATGLQYKIVKEGKGAKPGLTDTVKVHYKGTLLDGTEFDSSHKRKEPATFPVNQVIPGWTEGLQLMNEGSTFELYVPPALAYGDQGAPPVIQPGSLLKFEVELLEVQKADDKKKDEAAKKEEKK